MNAMTEPLSLPAEAYGPLRTPPHSIEAESSVLGGLMLDNRLWDHVGDIVTEADFYRLEHRLVFAAIASLVMSLRPADVVTVAEHLQAQGKAGEVGGMTYLNQLSQFVPSANNARRYAEIVREKAILRSLASAGDQIASSAFDTQGKPVPEVLEDAAKLIGAIECGPNQDDWEAVDVGMVRLLDRVQAQADGTAASDFIPTGLRSLDDRLDGGMRPGELIVIGARPSMGKSALGLTIAANVAAQDRTVGFFSMEMPRDQVVARLVSLTSHIHLSKLKRADRLSDFDWTALSNSSEILHRMPIRISDASGLTITQLRARARALRRRNPDLALLVVDYLGLMRGTDPKMPRVYQLEEITTGLKALAKELRLTVALLAQVSRKVEERSDQMPMLSDLRDSGSIEQDADIVIFVHREHKAKPNLGDEWKYHAKASVAKVRDGEPGLLDLMYVGENTRFMDWPADMQVPTSRARMANKGDDL